MEEKRGYLVDSRLEFLSAHKSACLYFGKSIYALIPLLKDSYYTASLNHKKDRELKTMNFPYVSGKHLRILYRVISYIYIILSFQSVSKYLLPLPLHGLESTGQSWLCWSGSDLLFVGMPAPR